MLIKLWQWWTDDRPIFAEPGVDRYFPACESCGRLRAYYHILARDGRGMTCRRCGSRKVVMRGVGPMGVPSWYAAWWMISAYVWRRLILRKAHQQDWDPRMPYRRVEFQGFS